MKKELKAGILSADKSADGRPTVGGVNIIADLVIPIFNFGFSGFALEFLDHIRYCDILRLLNYILSSIVHLLKII